MKKNNLALLSMIVFLTVFSLTTIFDLQIPFSNKKGNLTKADEAILTEANTLAEVTEEPVIQLFSYDVDISTNANETNSTTLADTEEQKESELTPTPEPEAATVTPEPIVTDVPKEESKYADIGISVAKDYVNIRKKASTDSAVLGKLYKGSACEIKKTKGDWYYVESGSVEGYVISEFIKTGISDEKLIEKYGTLSISVESDGLNVREDPTTDSKKLTVVYMNEVYPVVKDKGEWLKVKIPDDKVTGYVKSEYTELIVDFKEAVSKEEEEKLEQLKAEERAKKETEIKKQDSVSYEYNELQLLACLIHSEAGSQSYETKLAVANVVLNRMKSSRYPNSMKSVIYQSYQFTVAASGSLQKQLNNYSNYDSSAQKLTIKAAKDALSGSNNIGSRMHFNSYGAACKKGYDDYSNAVRMGGLLFW